MTASLNSAQLAYLQEGRRLARLATADETGMPHVVPVGMWRYNTDLATVDIEGHDLAATKKYRNVQANAQAALVVDDLASVDPWLPRGVVVQGAAQALPQHDDGAGALIRITPDKIASWGV